eukprot:SM000073S21465  [mRNA]  locus=s73:396546:397232:- [translate_table: standard]
MHLYKSLVGPSGWCIHFDRSSRTCRIYDKRPRFCRVEPEVFKDLYDVDEQDMDATACNFCRQSIRDVYGGRSKELKSFQRIIRTLGTR